MNNGRVKEGEIQISDARDRERERKRDGHLKMGIDRHGN